MDPELFVILLMSEHLLGNLCKTVWSDRESWKEYLERVRVYDPTASTFKRVHWALAFGHGLSSGVSNSGVGDTETGSSQYRVRPTPSQQNLVHGQSAPLRRLATGGLRMLNAAECSIEDRHKIRKKFININCLHQIARSISRTDSDQDQEKITRDKINRGHNLLKQQHRQLSKMPFAAKASLALCSWRARYRKQVVMR